MNILWLSWKDHDHPAAGGAEVIKDGLAKQLSAHGHNVIVLTARHKGSKHTSTHNGYTIIRAGGRLSVYRKAKKYYKKHLSDWPDIIIDECNTIPFFAKFYAKQPVVMFVHQLARTIWFYQMPPPFSVIGYVLEPLYLRLLNNLPAITVSKSSCNDLARRGFKKSRIYIIPEALNTKPLAALHASHKAADPTLLLHGAVRDMKRTLHAIKAFEQAKIHIPNLKLIISGQSYGKYGQKVTNYINASSHRHSITHYGKVSDSIKKSVMQKAHYIIVCSVKEGWGLIVSEAAAQGTPAIVYNVDGLRDAVGYGKYGLLANPNVYSLSQAIQKGFSKKTNYQQLQSDAYHFAKNLTFQNSYHDFIAILLHIHNNYPQK